MTDVVAPAAPVADPNTFAFLVTGTETQISINVAEIPAEIRLELLKDAIKRNVLNRVNAANQRFVKENAPFAAYDEAMKADATQTVVPLPTGDRPTLDLLTPASAARKDLYEGKLRRQGTGDAKRKKADPMTTTVTGVVVREVFQKKSEADSTYKYTDAVKEVSAAGGGIAYLDARIAALVAGGADAGALAKMKEDKYMKPARIILGLEVPKSVKEGLDIL